MARKVKKDAECELCSMKYCLEVFQNNDVDYINVRSELQY